jgi:hypothetical protein
MPTERALSQSLTEAALPHGRPQGRTGSNLVCTALFRFPKARRLSPADAIADLLSVIALPAWRKPALLLSNRSFKLAAPSDREVQNFHFDSAPATALGARVNNLERRF